MKSMTNRLLLGTALVGAISFSLVACDRSVEKAKAQPTQNIAQPIASAPDTNLSRLVTAAIGADKSLETSKISVLVVKGEVSLTGEVENQKQRDQAIKIAREINGVKSVNDKLVIKEEANSTN